MKRVSLLTTLLPFILFDQASAWETDLAENPTEAWRSIYLNTKNSTGNKPGEFNAYGSKVPAEHTLLSELSLLEIGAGNSLSPSGTFRLEVRDLRDYLWDKRSPRNAIERRALPPPSVYAGLPDYSFTMYDWIRKNEVCPVDSRINPIECHNYKTWHGAVTNSSHFGDLASRTYKRYHAIALGLARKAKTWQELLSAHEPENDLYKDFVLELEHAALSYEGIGQHFFQDRWAVGHMWNRWNGPDAEQKAFKALATNIEVGLFTGVIHGTEMISKQSDPMNSAWLYAGEAHPSTFVVGSRPLAYMGFGDDHLEDLYALSYAKGRKYLAQLISRPTDTMEGSNKAGVYWDYRDVLGQRALMIGCLASGWAEVIGTLKEVEGAYGSSGIKMNFRYQGAKPIDDECFNAWATNYSMALGLLTAAGEEKGLAKLADPKERLASAFTVSAAAILSKNVRSGVVVAGNYFANPPPENLEIQLSGVGSAVSGAVALTFNGLSRESYVQAFVNAYEKIVLDKDFDGTDLAKKAFDVDLESGEKELGLRRRDPPVSCTQGKACDGSEYKIANFLEPADLDDLPEFDLRGRDKRSMFLFYNKAHADHLCKTQVATKLFDDMRELNLLEGCMYLGSRFWHRTDPDYGDGPQKQQLQVVHNGQQKSLFPLCAILAPEEVEDPSDSVPRYLHAGYVPMNSPPGRKFDQALENWCQMTPVVDYIDPREDVVAISNVGESTVKITGQNFGETKGELWLWQGNVSWKAERVGWREDEISFEVPDKVANSVGDYCLLVTAAPRETSYGQIQIEKNPSPGHFIFRRLAKVKATLRGQSGTVQIGKEGCPLP
jgi:hypothetical protein